jgi:CBS-domain-containing membrane protein
MARSFRWGPFLPVRPEDTLLHVLLLLSKHRLKAVPVVDTASSKSVRGFITQVLPKFSCTNLLFQNLRLDAQTDI